MVRYVLFSLIAWIVFQWFRKYLNIPQKTRTRPTQPSSAPSQSPYDVLGVSPSASGPDIREAYQNLVRQYHPDRVASMPHEFQEVAERRTKEINAAYTELKRSGRLG